ncbi:hypothetical protein AAJ76_482000234 [Vairimorpha ceranae]|uniref:Uncharacterized protein n=1 Tax=Vairimorpha ceranae TaxID=40302 RepID=A0A0F9W982_9MICR|nr:hypothetical protein AAJ76_482000234 [Vairimorpha ceranae]KKO73555.1 hypothetical protein AAJ76_482000234 [Vairimorpha ceranae]
MQYSTIVLHIKTKEFPSCPFCFPLIFINSSMQQISIVKLLKNTDIFNLNIHFCFAFFCIFDENSVHKAICCLTKSFTIVCNICFCLP